MIPASARAPVATAASRRRRGSAEQFVVPYAGNLRQRVVPQADVRSIGDLVDGQGVYLQELHLDRRAEKRVEPLAAGPVRRKVVKRDQRGGQAAVRLANVEPGDQPLERTEVHGKLADEPHDEQVDMSLHSAPDAADGVEVCGPDHLVGPVANDLMELRADDLNQRQDAVLALRVVDQDLVGNPFRESFGEAEAVFLVGDFGRAGNRLGAKWDGGSPPPGSSRRSR